MADDFKVVASNRKARHDYEILEVVEAGLVLVGSEVKSLRDGKINIKDSFAAIERNEAWLYGMYVGPHAFSREGGHDTERTRKLLLKRREIDRLAAKIAEKGLTLIPLRLYFKDGTVKIELGLARGKRSFDKRQTVREREEKREMERSFRRRS